MVFHDWNGNGDNTSFLFSFLKKTGTDPGSCTGEISAKALNIPLVGLTV